MFLATFLTGNINRILIPLKIIKLNAIDSTNDYLKSLQREVVLEDDTVVLTLEQSKGRGQQGASWYMKRNESLAFSVFRRYSNLEVTCQFHLTMAVSLAIQKALSKLGLPAVSIKWPNDIMTGDKKICGILIENQLSGTKIKSSIIGVGLNVNNQSFPNLPQASSMKMATDVTFKIEKVLENVLDHISSELAHVKSTSFEELQERYESLLFRREKISVFEDARGNQFNGIIQGVNSQGELIVLRDEDRLQKFQMKEIKLLL